MLLDDMARIQHDIWSSWMKWLFKCCRNVEGEEFVIIPAEKVQRWKRQMNTLYDDLSEEEKESDRKVIREFFYVVPKHAAMKQEDAEKIKKNSIIINE